MYIILPTKLILTFSRLLNLYFMKTLKCVPTLLWYALASKGERKIDINDKKIKMLFI